MIEIRAESQLRFPARLYPNKCKSTRFVTGKISVESGSGINHLLGIAMSLRTALSRINNAYRNQMNRTFENQKVVLAFCVLSTRLVGGAFAYQTSLIPSSRLISPDELAKILQSSKGE